MTTTDDFPITAAVLGQGSIGRRHAALLREVGCRVVVWDPAGLPEGWAETEVAGPEEALADADVVVVASPTVNHREQLLLAIEHGCDVLVEKPPATTQTGLSIAVERVRSDSLIVAVGFNLRFHPGPATVAEIVRSGKIGRPLRAEFAFGSYLPDWRPAADYRTSYSARRDLGGGVLLDAIHELDYATWILGPAVDVDARLARQSDLQLDVEDTAMLSLHHESGALSMITLDYLDRSYHRGCRVVGTEASAVWSWEDSVVRVLGPSSSETHAIGRDAIDDSYRHQMRAFLEAVRSRRLPEPLCSLKDAVTTMRLVDAARIAAESGRRVPLTM